jgi:hypothetical protein
MMKLLLAALTILLPATGARAQVTPCTGPNEIPAAGVATAYCHNGRMGFALTEFAAISQLKNMPQARARAFAKREAELKARAALAEFLSAADLSHHDVQNEEELDSAERQNWQVFMKSTTEQTVRAHLKAGIVVIAVDSREGAVYVTVATSPDLTDLAKSVNNGFAK